MCNRVEIVCTRKGSSVELAAVVEVPAREDCAVPLWSFGRRLRSALPVASWAPVLGNDILGSWINRLPATLHGITTLWLTSEAA